MRVAAPVPLMATLLALVMASPATRAGSADQATSSGGTVFIPITQGPAGAPGPTPPRDVSPRQTATGTAALRGRVVDDVGTAIAGATVSLRLPIRDQEPQEVTTDAQGRYELRDLPAGMLLVRASRTGYVDLGPNQSLEVNLELAKRK